MSEPLELTITIYVEEETSYSVDLLWGGLITLFS